MHKPKSRPSKLIEKEEIKAEERMGDQLITWLTLLILNEFLRFMSSSNAALPNHCEENELGVPWEMISS